MNKYTRIILGRGNEYAPIAFEQGWIGVGWLDDFDLSGEFETGMKSFNKKYIDRVLEYDKTNSRVGAGLACGMTWKVGGGLEVGDRIIAPDIQGRYHIGEITGDYFYRPGEPLQHRRPVFWFSKTFETEEVSDGLRRSLSTRNTVADMSSHSDELDQLVDNPNRPLVDHSVSMEYESLSFALERQLEDFLVSNWDKTSLGKNYNIFSIDDVIVGQQFATDTGPIDILAQSKDGKELLVVELKRGRASDRVVGQILRYMSYIKEIDESKIVKGVIIGTEDDLGLQRALSMVGNVSFLRYRVKFELLQ